MGLRSRVFGAQQLHYYSIHESRKNLHSFSLSITVKDILHRICTTASKFEKQILKIGRCISRSLEYVECGHSMLLLTKGWQKNDEQRIITHAYTAIVLFATAVVVYLVLYSIKPNER